MNESEKNIQQEQSDAQKACEAQLKEVQEKYVRLLADFENFKKRQEKERLQIMRIGQAEVLQGLLDIIDIIERALKQKKDTVSADAVPWVQGFELLAKAFEKYLASVGIEEIKETTFNPQVHEAVMNVASPKHASGDIVEFLQKGYMFKGQVLRPAKVSIAQ